jgi:two-component system response regulator DesR
MRILVIDDDRPHGESLLDLLQSKGHEALYAQTDADARWLADLLRFDLAILDHDMPGTSGLRLAALLTEKFPGLLCVIVSARPAAEIPLGGLRFLPKPLPIPALLEMLIDLERQRGGAPLVLRTGFPMVKYR